MSVVMVGGYTNATTDVLSGTCSLRCARLQNSPRQQIPATLAQSE
eukprot:COSAG02_NODE_1718_length_11207_cov_2.888999_14_plen_45_part_00